MTKFPIISEGSQFEIVEEFDKQELTRAFNFRFVYMEKENSDNALLTIYNDEQYITTSAWNFNGNMWLDVIKDWP